MKIKFLCIFILTTILSSCAQEKRALVGETEFQRKINSEYKDATKSPLKAKDRKTFTSLEFFKYDTAFVVKALLTKTPNAKPFIMKTTTNRAPMYVQYGLLSFTLKEKECELEIYQSLGLIKDEAYKDYLFLPFLDLTNEDESYAGGRFIDCKIPINETMIIDFNSAYNPYCAYNDKYSCPIVPSQNFLDVKIEAGVKKFKKH